jgi:hypothetical protein
MSEVTEGLEQTPPSGPTKKEVKGKTVRTTKKKAAKKKKKKETTKKDSPEGDDARVRTLRPYPVVAFKEAMRVGDAIWAYAGGDKIRRLTLLEKIEISPTSSLARQLITNSGKYGITTGSYATEWIALTPDGNIACNPTASSRDRLAAAFRLAIQGVAPFKSVFEEYVSKRLVAKEVMYDFLNDKPELKVTDNAECVDLFIVNIRDLGLLRNIAGVESPARLAGKVFVFTLLQLEMSGQTIGGTVICSRAISSSRR